MSRSSSDNRTSTTNNTTDVTTSQGDNRVTDSGNIGGNVNIGQSGGNVSVSTTDYGAIDRGAEVSMAALDFGGDAIESNVEVTSNALINNRELAEQSINTLADSFEFWNQQTTQNVDRSLAFATQANTSENAQLLQSGVKFLSVAALAIGGTVVAVSVMKGRK